jgi:hypothetical protein
VKKSDASQGESASELISKRVAELGDWRGETLARMRRLIREEDPDVIEEWKWMGTPVWSHDGMICTGESYKAVVKLTFAKGCRTEGSDPPLQLESRGQRTPCDRYPRRAGRRRIRLQGARARGDHAQRRRQIEAIGGGEVLDEGGVFIKGKIRPQDEARRESKVPSQGEARRKAQAPRQEIEAAGSSVCLLPATPRASGRHGSREVLAANRAMPASESGGCSVFAPLLGLAQSVRVPFVLAA